VLNPSSTIPRHRRVGLMSAFEALAQRLEAMAASTPSSRGGSSFSGGPDETSQPSGPTGGG
jgi:hypothetical protein